MKTSKILVLVAAGILAAALALVGCTSGGSSSKSASASASAASASASAASASASAASTSASATSASASAASASASAASGEATYKLVTPGKLTVITAAEYPPFENLENGEYVGLDIEIIKIVAEKLGLELAIENVNFDTIFTTIAGGVKADVSISGITVDPDRAKVVTFTDSYYTDDQAIAVMKGGNVTKDNANAELNKKDVKIAVQSGTTGESYVQENYPEATCVPYAASTDCFAYLQSGQVDAVCTNLAVVDKMIKTAYGDAEIVQSIATGEEYAIAVNQDNPLLTEAINKILAEMATDGTLDRLIEQYLG